MRTKKNSWLIWVSSVLLVAVVVYSALGVFQAAMLSGDPNYPAERSEFNARIWGGLFIAASSGLIWTIVRICKRQKGNK